MLCPVPGSVTQMVWSQFQQRKETPAKLPFKDISHCQQNPLCLCYPHTCSVNEERATATQGCQSAAFQKHRIHSLHHYKMFIFLQIFSQLGGCILLYFI